MLVMDDGTEQQPLKTALHSANMATNITERRQLRLRRQRAVTFAAFVGLGLASWLLTNATYVELGVFLQQLPEHYRISAYAILALESANVYPVLYLLLNGQEQLLNSSSAIWWILVQAFLVASFMSIFWAQTISVLGSRHSVAMLVLTHLGGMVSTTSSVVLYPYVANYPPLFTSALATGEGLSGSLAAFLGLVQDPGNSLRFSVSTFYLVCAVVMCGSLAAFAFLQVHPWAKAVQMSRDTENGSIQYRIQQQSRFETGERETEKDTLLTGSLSASFDAMSKTVVMRQVWPLLACQWVMAALSFGWLPSTMPYVYKKFASMDDSDAATARFQTTASIAALILSPVASMATTWVRVYYVRSMTFALVAMASLLLSFSLRSKPILSDNKHGYLLPLLVHIFYLVGCAYTQTMLYLTLKRAADTTYSTNFARQVYQWNGLATQLGAMSGTAIAFPLVFWCENLFTT